eukprot:CAMPEP_0174283006 /NCGR_PEP_ID=MMETSP0809-20121228/3595_1 /TAXON_ID=73025 ORGANISM="Eutreptiella gymnastica-like, Strain CCMP1594" /NCGR_SAMPLE_ID=MMETSP0809 /ASSEMBLY_ACC=CAM_ASM_000658 /LENGTH=50 /DNA_ID=CAMNT_0015377595 /DNA_START=202 /DNA_END=354 /DNA_ORIENTATION=-
MCAHALAQDSSASDATLAQDLHGVSAMGTSQALTAACDAKTSHIRHSQAP